MHVPAFYYTDIPASVTNDPYGYAISIFGLLGSNILAFAWITTIITRMFDDPFPLKHQVSLYRWSMFLMLIGVLLRSGPDVLLVTLWHDVLPATRFALARWNRFLDGVSIFPMVAAFMIGLFTTRLVESQIAREPIPLDLLPTRATLFRGAWFCMLLMFISVMIAFR